MGFKIKIKVPKISVPKLPEAPSLKTPIGNLNPVALAAPALGGVAGAIGFATRNLQGIASSEQPQQQAQGQTQAPLEAPTLENETQKAIMAQIEQLRRRRASGVLFGSGGGLDQASVASNTLLGA